MTLDIAIIFKYSLEFAIFIRKYAFFFLLLLKIYLFNLILIRLIFIYFEIHNYSAGTIICLLHLFTNGHIII
jgi:hypothetical protein